MSVILQNLRKYVQYELQVLAYTRIGDGCLSIPEVVVKTDGDGMLVSDYTQLISLHVIKSLYHILFIL